MYYISDKERNAIKELLNCLSIKKAWVVGGALLRQDSKDIDVVVAMEQMLTDTDFHNLITSGAWSMGEWAPKEVFETYECMREEKNSIRDDGGTDLVVHMEHTDKDIRPVDLLVCSTQYTTIDQYMHEYFPLPIQRIAVDAFDWSTVRDHASVSSDFVLVSPHCNADTLRKYKQYYPNKSFFMVSVNETIQEL